MVGIDNLSRPGSALNLQWLHEIGTERWFFDYGDVRGSHEVDLLFERHSPVQLVVHLAAQVAVTTSVMNPRSDFEINAFGTLNVLEAIRKYSPSAYLIFASTNKVYGGLESIAMEERSERYQFSMLPAGISEDQKLDFHSPYGCSKGAADQYVRDYSRIYGLKTCVCRQSCIYGTRQFGVEDQGWVAWFIIAALLGRPVMVYGDGKQVRDLLYVGDLIEAFVGIYKADDRTSGKIYNLGGGASNTLSVKELIGSIPKLTGKKLDWASADWRPGDQKAYVSDIWRLRDDIGWQPTITVNEGLEYLTDWAKNNLDHIKHIIGIRA